MIEYTDMGVLDFFRQLFPDPKYLITWAYPGHLASKAALVRAAEKKLNAAKAADPAARPSRPYNTKGFPGFTVFRSNSARNDEINNTVMSNRGMPIGNTPNRQVQITLRNGIRTGDVIQFTIVSADIAGGDVSVAHTVTDEDSIGSICQNFTDLINANDLLQAAGITSFAFTNGFNVFRSKTSTNPITIVNSSSGLGPEHIKIQTDLKGDFVRLQAVHMRADYTICAWAESQSDLNSMERALAFADVYEAVEASVHGMSWRWFIRWRNDLTYNHILDEKQDKIIDFGFTTSFYVDTEWAHTKFVPPINTIIVKFQEIMDGAPVDLDSLSIVKLDS